MSDGGAQLLMSGRYPFIKYKAQVCPYLTKMRYQEIRAFLLPEKPYTMETVIRSEQNSIMKRLSSEGRFFFGEIPGIGHLTCKYPMYWFFPFLSVLAEDLINAQKSARTPAQTLYPISIVISEMSNIP